MLLSLLNMLLLATAAAASNQWFVSPHGRDSWSGTLPESNAAGSDGPVASVSRAAALVRSRDDRATPATVSISPGTYQQTAPLVFGTRDGGDGEAGRVTWRGQGEAALSFGVALGNNASGDARWSRRAGSDGVWQRRLPSAAVAAGIQPRQLWMAGGARMTRARHPDTGTDFLIPLDGALKPAEGGASSGFAYTDGDLNRQYTNISDVEVIVYASWSASRHYIKELNTSTAEGRRRTVTFTANCLNPPAGMWPNSGNRYYIEGDASFVDHPGEWHADSSGLVTLVPPEGVSDPNEHEWVVDRGGALNTALQLKDDSPAPETVLVQNLSGGAAPIVLPAASVSFSAANWNLSFGVSLPAGKGGSILSRGPVPSKHVPGDTSLAVAGGKLVMDFGWETTLFGASRIDDGKPHQVTIAYAQKRLRWPWAVKSLSYDIHYNVLENSCNRMYL
jgi:hypothetical protein